LAVCNDNVYLRWRLFHLQSTVMRP
jgi:hypothetical protein